MAALYAHSPLRLPILSCVKVLVSWMYLRGVTAALDTTNKIKPSASSHLCNSMELLDLFVHSSLALHIPEPVYERSCTAPLSVRSSQIICCPASRGTSNTNRIKHIRQSPLLDLSPLSASDSPTHSPFFCTPRILSHTAVALYVYTQCTRL